MSVLQPVVAGPESQFARISTIRGLSPGHVVIRYGKAIRSYLLALLECEEDVNEVALRIHAKILKGHLEQWNPADGRFRDYLKVAVRNAARDFQRERRRRVTEIAYDDLSQVQCPHGPATARSDAIWLDVWREALVESVVAKLRTHQEQTPDNVFYFVVRILDERPGLSSDELAQELSVRSARPFTAANARKQKERAQAKFAELLIQEVMLTIADPTQERVEDELRSAGLLAYVEDCLSDAYTAATRKHLRQTEGGPGHGAPISG